MDVTFSPALRVYAEMWEIAGRRREADAQFSQALAHIRSGTPDASTFCCGRQEVSKCVQSLVGSCISTDL